MLGDRHIENGVEYEEIWGGAFLRCKDSKLNKKRAARALVKEFLLFAAKECRTREIEGLDVFAEEREEAVKILRKMHARFRVDLS